MLKWMKWIGYALIALGAALLSPIADYLPVDIEPLLTGDFASLGSPPYFRVAPGASGAAHVVSLGALLAGAALVVFARVVRPRGRSQ